MFFMFVKPLVERGCINKLALPIVFATNTKWNEFSLHVRWVDGANPPGDHGVPAHRPEGPDRLPDSLRQERWRRGPRNRHCPLGRPEFTRQHRVTAQTHTQVFTHCCAICPAPHYEQTSLSVSAGHT